MTVAVAAEAIYSVGAEACQDRRHYAIILEDN